MPQPWFLLVALGTGHVPYLNHSSAWPR